MKKHLTDQTIRALAPTGKVRRIGDGNNLYLTMSPTGAKSWLFIWFDKTANKQREMGLGSYTGDGRAVVVTLKHARELAEDCRSMIRHGRNPLEEKIAAKVGVVGVATFADMFALTLEKRKAGKGWKIKNGVCTQELDWTAKIDNHAASLKDEPVGGITKVEVAAALAPIWFESPTTAERVRNIMEAVFATAIAEDKYVGPNPATIDLVEGKLGAQPQAEGDKQPSLKYGKLPAAVVALLDDGRIGAQLAVFTTLTGTRRDEARLMQRGEVDEATRLWVIPAERMKVKTKNDRAGAHVVPLSDAAWRLYKSIAPVVGNPYVFAGRKDQPVSASIPNDMIVKPRNESGVLGLKGEATLHGMRATFSTWANDNKFNADAIELCLAHVTGNGKTKTTRSYNRAEMLEERTAILQAWGEFVMMGVEAARAVEQAEAA